MNPIALTPGEPAGIGPECVLRHRLARPGEPLVAVADPELLTATARRFDLPVSIVPWQPGDPLPADEALGCLPIPLAAPATPGMLDTANGPYVLDTLRAAVELVRLGHASALVTGPVHKGIINESGATFTGHTEFLADLAGVPRVVMMLAAGDLRVALVTTHLPLSAVPAAITRDSVGSALRITGQALQQQFGIAEPHIQVLGLNPHAGEGGHLGSEDDEIIAPAVAALDLAGIRLSGPVPADTAFTPRALAGCDAVLAMYHDQGLPVLKHAGFGRAVNITLGLPFIRTSVDHGTALDIAARGGADASSLGYAVDQAMTMTGAGRIRTAVLSTGTDREA
ncbi:MAG: 4-hydroxythreonine-4-phosphate dehydrogenase PdxA [Xanthomonadales bacterium]|jgi:4-hydroxythreonine-4-phosphate dehydrogenase|nr:4-hydroxythreonine-4-phosphate dehydrogenase PdxA [Xanthomonadales bacterium]